MIRALCLAGGLAGAAGLSQFPEFSQQYLQRLGGQVDALTVEVKKFDASALAEGLGREEALQSLGDEGFQGRHQTDMRVMFDRHARLSANLAVLREASPIQRLTLPHRMADAEVLEGTWSDFSPAMPISAAGAVAAGAGFLGGWLLLAMLIAAVTTPFKRSRKTAPASKRREPGVRRDPPVAAPKLVATTPDNRPRLSGVKR